MAEGHHKLVWVALVVLALAKSAENVNPSTVVAKITVENLKEVVEEVLTEVLNKRRDEGDVIEGVPLHNNCTDSSEYNDCELVVQQNLCNTAMFYARYCCRSCTLAKQTPTYGPHLQHTAEAPIKAVIKEGKTIFPRGTKVTISCEVSGYPAPEVVWMRTNFTITTSDKYEFKVRASPGPLIQALQADLIILDFNSDDMDDYTCMAINRVGLTKTSVHLSPEYPVQAMISTDVITYPVGTEVTLTCHVKSYSASTVTWYKEEKPLEASEKFKIGDRSSKEGSFEAVRSRLTIVSAEKKDSGQYVCRAANEEGASRSVKKIFISDAIIHPNCTDIADSKDCSNDFLRCNYQEYVARYCCRTCTMAGILPPWGLHLMSDAQAPLEVDITPPYGSFPYDSDVELRCIGGSYPRKPKVEWKKDDQTIEKSDKYQVTEEDSDTAFKKQVVSILTIARVKVSDSGRYTCVASRGKEKSEDSGTLIFKQDGTVQFLD